MLTNLQVALRDKIAEKYGLKGDELQLFSRLVELNHDSSHKAEREFDRFIMEASESEYPESVETAFTEYQRAWLNHVRPPTTIPTIP